MIGDFRNVFIKHSQTLKKIFPRFLTFWKHFRTYITSMPDTVQVISEAICSTTRHGWKRLTMWNMYVIKN